MNNKEIKSTGIKDSQSRVCNKVLVAQALFQLDITYGN